jgi:hypothetical protein
MNETAASVSHEEHRAVGRIRIVAGYFGICAIASAVVTVYALVALAVPSLGLRHGKPIRWSTLGALAGLIAVTFGFARTYLLLRRYERKGAYVAGVCLAAWLLGTFWGHVDSWSGIIIPALGLGFLGLGWRELEPPS